MATKRKDSNRIVLKKGEYQRSNGTYAYRWTDENGKRHEVYAKCLDDLRAKEAEIDIDSTEGLKAEARYTIINEMFDLWEELKRGLKDNTFENYKYMYNTLNKALRRIIRDCNDEVLLANKKPTVLLPHFTCHSLRHTFSTRMCEAGINVKVIQDNLGHQDISTTMNIYTDATKEMKKQEFESLDSYLKKAV